MQKEENLRLHEPVLVKEVLESLEIVKLVRSKEVKIIDATLGLGGHAIEFVKLGANVLGIDLDKESLEIARRRLMKACPSPQIDNLGRCFKLVQGNFREIDRLAVLSGFVPADAILFDLGISSYQLAKKEKGFSFQYKDAPLDMRLDTKNQNVTAKDLVCVLSKSQLVTLFEKVLPLPKARKLAESIVNYRERASINTVGDLLTALSLGEKRVSDLHPATLAFLALRIAVNSELANLEEALPKAFEILGQGGKLAVISFHSGEDVVVKKYFKKIDAEGLAKLVTKKPIVPTELEIETNPRARSAKMRVLQKI